jgi:DNA-binding Xre family transcriptional regulator
MNQKISTKPKSIPPAAMRINILMAERGIRFVTDLHGQLQKLGIDVSHSHLSRLVNNTSKSITFELLAGLAKVFDCNVSELFAEQEKSTK